MTFSKNDVLRVLNMKASREIRIDADTDLLKKIEYVHYLIFRNEITPRIMRTLVFNFGLLCVTELVDNGKVTNIFHLLKIYKTVFNTLKEYVETSLENEPFTPLHVIKKILLEVKARSYSEVQTREFFSFIESLHKEVLNDKIILDEEDWTALFVAFESSKIRMKPI